MINTLTVLGLTVLLLANLFLFLIITFFVRNKNDTASRIGFGFMELVYLGNMLAIIGGIF